MARERAQADRALALNTSGMDSASKRLIAENRGDTLDASMDSQLDVDMNAEVDVGGAPETVDDARTEDTEGAYLAHALRDVYYTPWRQYHDQRTWRQRTTRQSQNWEPVMPSLVAAYLEWKYPSTPCSASSEQSASPSVTRTSSPMSEEDAGVNFDISVIDIHEGRQTTLRVRRPDSSISPSVDLARHGCIGNSPLNPSFAITIKTLELYRRLRMRKPSFSAEAYTKLENEPERTFNRIVAMDGNNSMKRVYSLGGLIRNPKPFTDTDYLLPPEYVDQFADEVPSRRAPAVPVVSDDAADEGWEDVGDLEEVPCTTNFKAAAADEKKKMWDIFEETGFFVSACRHSLIMWFSDMIRSGELSKHPLAHIAKCMDILEERLLVGSDIGCSLKSTIANSSLGAKFKQKQNRCCVNAFHGYTHNWACQKQNHPNVIAGLGLEDLETLERIFSASNAVAGVTRNATPYRRRVFIDLFFRQWDEDKYYNLSKLLYNNYRQALAIINCDAIALKDTLISLQATEADLDAWHEDEVAYFASKPRENEWDVYAIAYVGRLRELQAASNQYRQHQDTFMNSTPESYQFLPPSSQHASSSQYATELSQTRRAETARRVADERHAQVLAEVVSMELKMGITRRWQPSDQEYVDTLKYMTEREFHNALDKLHRLVIQRLFELSRLNLAKTAYHMRTQIAKNLQRRCKAIQSAVTAYNTAARALDPPRPTLDWSKASHYSFLEDFQLFRETNKDLADKPWSSPLVRVAIKQHNRVKRAHEEIGNCNIDIRRLQTYALDENTDLGRIVEDLHERREPIAGAVEEYVIRRIQVNKHLLSGIYKIHRLTGFTGDTSPGVRIGRVMPSAERVHAFSMDRTEDDEDDDSDEAPPDSDSDDDEAQEQYQGLVNFISDMPGHV
ncbi:hypothetical protein HWV62_24418 [Athelia sp. TMB]|nr:hypothetical protein HWV62_24418 [Athelia sp. TMB]